MKKNKKLEKLYLMIITIPKGKKEIIADMLEAYDVSICLNTLAKGTNDLSLTKEIMMCIIKDSMIKDAISSLEDKFSKFHSKISMVYTIPLSSMVGTSSYMALTNGGKK